MDLFGNPAQISRANPPSEVARHLYAAGDAEPRGSDERARLYALAAQAQRLAEARAELAHRCEARRLARAARGEALDRFLRGDYARAG